MFGLINAIFFHPIVDLAVIVIIIIVLVLTRKGKSK
jgi:hypothetical protein